MTRHDDVNSSEQDNSATSSGDEASTIHVDSSLPDPVPIYVYFDGTGVSLNDTGKVPNSVIGEACLQRIREGVGVKIPDSEKSAQLASTTQSNKGVVIYHAGVAAPEGEYDGGKVSVPQLHQQRHAGPISRTMAYAGASPLGWGKTIDEAISRALSAIVSVRRYQKTAGKQRRVEFKIAGYSRGAIQAIDFSKKLSDALKQDPPIAENVSIKQLDLVDPVAGSEMGVLAEAIKRQKHGVEFADKTWRGVNPTQIGEVDECNIFYCTDDKRSGFIPQVPVALDDQDRPLFLNDRARVRVYKCAGSHWSIACRNIQGSKNSTADFIFKTITKDTSATPAPDDKVRDGGPMTADALHELGIEGDGKFERGALTGEDYLWPALNLFQGRVGYSRTIAGASDVTSDAPIYRVDYQRSIIADCVDDLKRKLSKLPKSQREFDGHLIKRNDSDGSIDINATISLMFSDQRGFYSNHLRECYHNSSYFQAVKSAVMPLKDIMREDINIIRVANDSTHFFNELLEELSLADQPTAAAEAADAADASTVDYTEITTKAHLFELGRGVADKFVGGIKHHMATGASAIDAVARLEPEVKRLKDQVETLTTEVQDLKAGFQRTVTLLEEQLNQKDNQINQKDNQINQKDNQIADLQRQLKMYKEEALNAITRGGPGSGMFGGHG